MSAPCSTPLVTSAIRPCRPCGSRGRWRCARSWPQAWPSRAAPTGPCSRSPPPAGRPPTSAAAAADLLGPDAGRGAAQLGDAAARTAVAPRRHRRPAAGDLAPARPPRTTAPRVVVATVRSLIQPMAPGLGELAPVQLRVGDEADFDAAARAAGRARLHPGRHGREARRDRRPRRHSRHLPADRRPPGAGRVLGRRDHRPPLVRRADQRSLGRSTRCPRRRCREILLTEPVRERAAALARTRREQPDAARDAGQPGQRHQRRGHGVADPGAGRRRAGAAHRPGAAPARTWCWPTRSGSAPARADLVRTGQEFLAASWMAAGDRRARADRPRAVAYRELGRGPRRTPRDAELPIWRITSFERRAQRPRSDDAARPAVHAVESYRGDPTGPWSTCARTPTTGGTAVLVVAGPAPRQRARSGSRGRRGRRRRRRADRPAGRRGGHRDLRGSSTDGFTDRRGSA